MKAQKHRQTLRSSAGKQTCTHAFTHHHQLLSPFSVSLSYSLPLSFSLSISFSPYLSPTHTHTHTHTQPWNTSTCMNTHKIKVHLTMWMIILLQ